MCLNTYNAQALDDVKVDQGARAALEENWEESDAETASNSLPRLSLPPLPADQQVPRPNQDLSLAWLGWDCSLVLVTPSNPGLSSPPASHWQAPQHRESRGRSSPPLLPPLLQPSRPRSASRSPPPEDDLDHWVRIIGTCEQSTLNHQSQMKYCWLNRVPLGQRKLYLVKKQVQLGTATLACSEWLPTSVSPLKSRWHRCGKPDSQLLDQRSSPRSAEHRRSLVIPANFLNLVELSLTNCISGWIKTVLWVLFRHLGVASESGVWREGKDRVILCTNKNFKIQSYHCWQNLCLRVS